MYNHYQLGKPQANHVLVRSKNVQQQNLFQDDVQWTQISRIQDSFPKPCYSYKIFIPSFRNSDYINIFEPVLLWAKKQITKSHWRARKSFSIMLSKLCGWKNCHSQIRIKANIFYKLCTENVIQVVEERSTTQRNNFW